MSDHAPASRTHATRIGLKVTIRMSMAMPLPYFGRAAHFTAAVPPPVGSGPPERHRARVDPAEGVRPGAESEFSFRGFAKPFQKNASCTAAFLPVRTAPRWISTCPAAPTRWPTRCVRIPDRTTPCPHRTSTPARYSPRLVFPQEIRLDG